jgi:uncharacterized protein (DUF302 family)
MTLPGGLSITVEVPARVATIYYPEPSDSRVLYVHNLGATLRNKGIAFEEDCKIFEVCNPGQAAKVLSTDMRLNMALPCRISVFTEKGKTMIGLIPKSNH